jgi:1,4-dihydroxy-2-naphthoyl-CoA hydrolase
MSIWFKSTLTLDEIKTFAKDTMNEYIGIEFTELGENFMRAKMPVDNRTRQAYGILHGGASVTLAETIGSVASAMVLDMEQFFCVGLEINANHLRSVKEGFVEGTALPLHIGGLTHVWDIRIRDHQENLICVCRLTVAILKRK